ncbi:tetratricopeptide repeat protein [Dongia sp.]|uniref:tetratricopeptide repeat protein n=1 Tax=Dongia sp. TaxID=1977262 RepID=UPI003753A8DA
MGAVFAVILLAGLGAFIWRSEPLPPTQEELAADFAKGTQFERGNGGVTLDYAQALAFYRKAAEGGYPAAENALGLMTAAGHGVVRDEKAANDWFRRAAEHGFAEAQVTLAGNLLTGTGTADGKPDKIEALKWLLIGAEGMPDPLSKQVAVTTRDKLAQELGAEGQAEAAKRADQWRKEHAQ